MTRRWAVASPMASQLSRLAAPHLIFDWIPLSTWMLREEIIGSLPAPHDLLQTSGKRPELTGACQTRRSGFDLY